jgi:hypothetical protein
LDLERLFCSETVLLFLYGSLQRCDVPGVVALLVPLCCWRWRQSGQNQNCEPGKCRGSGKNEETRDDSAETRAGVGSHIDMQSSALHVLFSARLSVYELNCPTSVDRISPTQLVREPVQMHTIIILSSSPRSNVFRRVYYIYQTSSGTSTAEVKT